MIALVWDFDELAYSDKLSAPEIGVVVVVASFDLVAEAGKVKVNDEGHGLAVEVAVGVVKLL